MPTRPADKPVTVAPATQAQLLAAPIAPPRHPDRSAPLAVGSPGLEVSHCSEGHRLIQVHGLLQAGSVAGGAGEPQHGERARLGRHALLTPRRPNTLADDCRALGL